MNPTEAKCKSCGAPIYWVTTAAEKAMPVDVAPDPSGGFVLSLRPSTGQLRAEVFGNETHRARKRYTSHFATCPNAAAHRKAST